MTKDGAVSAEGTDGRSRRWVLVRDSTDGANRVHFFGAPPEDERCFELAIDEEGTRWCEFACEWGDVGPSVYCGPRLEETRHGETHGAAVEMVWRVIDAAGRDPRSFGAVGVAASVFSREEIAEAGEEVQAARRRELAAVLRELPSALEACGSRPEEIRLTDLVSSEEELQRAIGAFGASGSLRRLVLQDWRLPPSGLGGRGNGDVAVYERGFREVRRLF
mmetsp:Transcript_18758/g.44842  ORF Transcript_18758/g.44842 Transcript_18758/m.44842 type:complete len:220 (+) Transcript_18758:733-1392(+)